MSKNDTIIERFAILEQKTGKSANTLGKEAGLGNGTVDRWKDNQLADPNLHAKQFLKHHNINPKWWETGKGEVFLTSVQERSDNTENAGESVDQMLAVVEESKDYFVIPRAVLRENYRLVALEYFEAEKQKLEHERVQFKEQAEKDRMNLEAHIETNRRLLSYIETLTSQLAQIEKDKK